MTIIKDLYEISKDSKNYLKTKQYKNKIEEKIYTEIFNNNIRVCLYCSGFVDKTIPECPHCYKQLGLLANDTLALNINECNEKNIIDFKNEGIYIGRYSRGKEYIIDND